MRLRSLLFVPGDRPERFAKAGASGADAIILDLEDSVVPARKAAAREAVAALLASAGDSVLRFVRVNPLDSEFLNDDLAVIAGGGRACLAQVRVGGVDRGTGGARRHRLPADPARRDRDRGGGVRAWRLWRGRWTARGADLGGPRICPAAIGAETAREAGGRYTPPYEVVRALTLFGAHAAGVAAIETVYPDIRDAEGLAAYAARGARDGFTGMMAIYPAQVAAINAAFTPSADAVAHARAVGRSVRGESGGGRVAARRADDRCAAPEAGAAAAGTGWGSGGFSGGVIPFRHAPVGCPVGCKERTSVRRRNGTSRRAARR